MGGYKPYKKISAFAKPKKSKTPRRYEYKLSRFYSSR